MTASPPLPVPAATLRADAPATARVRRFDRLDAWRGVAIVWMACFHFSFDLNMYGFLRPAQNFLSDPFWTGQRACIVSLFLLGAGASQAIAVDAGQTWRRFWRRWAQIAACALLVSLATLQMFPHSWISFGVLHGIAVMLIALRALGAWLPPQRLARSPVAFAGVALVALGAWTLHDVVQAPFFDTRLTNWVGLVTRLPVTEDFVPVFPWLGMMLAGYLVASLLLVHGRALIAGAVPVAVRPLAVLGRWSLSFYMLHQPILLGSLLLFQNGFPMSARILFGFHAITVRMKTAPQSIIELHVESNRRDARMRQFVERARESDIRIIETDGDRLDKLASTTRHQGVVARVEVVAMPHSLDEVVESIEGPPLLLVLDGVTDPHNLGACLRVADGAGAHAVVAPKDHAVGVNGTVAKVASGAAETVPYIMVTNLARTLNELKDFDIRIIGTSDDAEHTLYDIDLAGPVAFVLGSEGDGMRQLTRKTCDELVRIPMAGAVESLNVSVAAGVCLFEAMRQRMKAAV